MRNPVGPRGSLHHALRAALLLGIAPLLLATIAGVSLVAPGTAMAERADRDKPIAWSGARLNGKRNEGGVDVVEVEGKVVVTQGTRTILADRAVIRQNADGSMSATAYGNPMSYREKRDGTDEFIEAFAQRAEYDGQKKVLELFDKALLRRDKDEIRASYIVYNTESETYRAEGQRGTEGKADSGSDGRVRGIFQPKPRDAKDGKGSSKDAKDPPKDARDSKEGKDAKDAKSSKDGKTERSTSQRSASPSTTGAAGSKN